MSPVETRAHKAQNLTHTHQGPTEKKTYLYIFRIEMYTIRYVACGVCSLHLCASNNLSSARICTYFYLMNILRIVRCIDTSSLGFAHSFSVLLVL